MVFLMESLCPHFRTKHKICILAYHNLCFCVFVILGMLHYLQLCHLQTFLALTSLPHPTWLQLGPCPLQTPLAKTDLTHHTWLHNRMQNGRLSAFITNAILFPAAAAAAAAAAVISFIHCAIFAAAATAASSAASVIS